MELRQEIDLCLNCNRIGCSSGKCSLFQKNARIYRIIGLKRKKDGTKEKRYFIRFNGKSGIQTESLDFDSPYYTKKQAIKMLTKIKERVKNNKNRMLWTIEMDV